MSKIKTYEDPSASDACHKDEASDDVDTFRAEHKLVSPEINTKAMAVFGRIYRISTRITPHIESVFRSHGLERGEYDVLATLLREGPPHRKTPTEVYTSLMVSSGGLTHRLKRLEDAKLIRRFPCPEDGRRLIIELTDEGFRRTKAAFKDDMRLENGWLADLSEEDFKNLEDLLRRLNISVPEVDT